MSTDANISINIGGKSKASTEALTLIMKTLKRNNANQKKMRMVIESNMRKENKSKKTIF